MMTSFSVLIAPEAAAALIENEDITVKIEAIVANENRLGSSRKAFLIDYSTKNQA
jgi:hypothetical protein